VSQITRCDFVGFEILTAAVIKSSVFWDVMLQPLASYFMLFSCLCYSSTQKMEAACSTKTLVDFQQTAYRYIPEDRTLRDVILFQGMLGYHVHEKCHVCFKIVFRLRINYEGTLTQSTLLKCVCGSSKKLSRDEQEMKTKLDNNHFSVQKTAVLFITQTRCKQIFFVSTLLSIEYFTN
jgi:hypothetical protein